MIHALSFVELPAPGRPALLTIGSFDGVHLGHQSLIREMLAAAQDQGFRSAAVTFFPHPSIVLRGQRPGFYLTSPDEKAAQFEQLGLDVLLTHPFSHEVSLLTAQQFIDRLRVAFDFREIWCGADFAFGHNREGTIDWLRSHGVPVRIVEPVNLGGDVISSSRIRRALEAGDIGDANACLGRAFSLAGTVVQGSKRGRTIGIPTANLDWWPEHAAPARGVYACRAWVAGSPVQAVTNIGIRPTFGSENRTFIEAHLLDFDSDLYGQTLRLDFLARLRSEQKFSGVPELVAQIHKDIEAARELLKSQFPGTARRTTVKAQPQI